MNKVVCLLAWLLVVGPPAGAGVVIEMVETSSSGEGSTHKIYAQGQMLRMDPDMKESIDRMSVIFRDDTLWLVNHDDKKCQTIDKESMEQIGSQLSDAMKMMEEQLAGLPEEQRAMMEKMMKGRMPGGMGQESPPRRVETGATEKVGDYKCVVHTLHVGDEKVWEVCAASKDQLSGASEAMGAFKALSEFTQSLQENFSQGPFSSVINTPFYDMDEIDGFPVRVRTFDGGRLDSESILKSVTRKDLEESLFSVPEGYKVKSLADQMSRGR